MEEISLSKLMDAETDKIKYITQMRERCRADDLLSVNSSVNSTLMNMIKLQMLLQFKLENVERLLPPKPPCPPEPPCPPPPCPPPPSPPCPPCPPPPCPPPPPPPCSLCCYVSGRGCGCLCGACEEFSGAKAVLRADISSNAPAGKNLLSYTVRGCHSALSMNAYAHRFCLCPLDCGGQAGVVVTGNGKVTKQSPGGGCVTGFAAFRVTVWDRWDKEGFQVVLSSCEPELNHDSGFVPAKSARWLINESC